MDYTKEEREVAIGILVNDLWGTCESSSFGVEIFKEVVPDTRLDDDAIDDLLTSDPYVIEQSEVVQCPSCCWWVYTYEMGSNSQNEAVCEDCHEE